MGSPTPTEWRFGGSNLWPRHLVPNCCCHLANGNEAILPIAKLVWCLESDEGLSKIMMVKGME